MLFFLCRALHSKTGSAIGDIVGEVDEELRKTALGGCIITKNRGKGGVPEWFRKTLTQGFPSSAVVTQAGKQSVWMLIRREGRCNPFHLPKEATHDVLQ